MKKGVYQSPPTCIFYDIVIRLCMHVCMYISVLCTYVSTYIKTFNVLASNCRHHYTQYMGEMQFIIVQLSNRRRRAQHNRFPLPYSFEDMSTVDHEYSQAKVHFGRFIFCNNILLLCATHNMSKAIKKLKYT